jgi:hypothetical protein
MTSLEQPLNWKLQHNCSGAQKLTYKAEITAVGNRHADHVAPSIRKSSH